MSNFYEVNFLIAHMTLGRDEGTEKELVMCSKCNEVFENRLKIYTTL
jgi:hypothetical protein